MAWAILFLAIGLGVLWIVGVSAGGVAAWFLWITFAIAIVLIALAAIEVTRLPKTRRPV